ncbi:MAG: type I secretion C-terminal target domain-containing protein [Alphaproteobacteria bacterium]|nr:type I secretion C-terminal target domain-containing protein [Alphaproteobacteria bacterium]
MSLDYNTLSQITDVTFEQFKSAHQSGNKIAAQYYDALRTQAQQSPNLSAISLYAIQAAEVVRNSGIRGRFANNFSASEAQDSNINFTAGSDNWLRMQYALMKADLAARQESTSGELNFEITIEIHNIAFSAVNIDARAFSIREPLLIIAKYDPALAQQTFIESITNEDYFGSVFIDGLWVAGNSIRAILEAEIANGNAEALADLVALTAWVNQATPAFASAAGAEAIQDIANGVTYLVFDHVREIIINGGAFPFKEFTSGNPSVLTNQELIRLIQGDFFLVGEAGSNARFRAVGELADRYINNPSGLATDGISVTLVNNGGGNSTVFTHNGIGIASLTNIQRGSYIIQTAEVIGIGGAPDAVQIMTRDTYAGSFAHSEVIEIKYPESFNFTAAGGYFGGLIADNIADDSIFRQVLYRTLFTTAGQVYGTYADLISVPENSLSAARFAATNGVDTGILDDLPALGQRLASNLASSIAGVLSRSVTEELGEAIDIGGVAGEVLDVALGSVTTGVINDVINVTFRDMNSGLYTNLINKGFTPEISAEIRFEIAKAFAGYVGSRLAGEIVTPESQQAAVFGSIGSTLGISIATNTGILANLTISTAVKAAFGTFGSFAPIIGTAIGAFVGQIAGTLIGNLFASKDEPISWATIQFDKSTNSYGLIAAWGDDGGDPAIARDMANAMIPGINDILELTSGTLRRASNAPIVELGLDGDHFGVIVDGTPTRFFPSSAEAIEHAAFNLLKGFDLVGGHAVLMRAWHNSDATTLQEFKEDLEVAEAFQAYLSNPAGIIAVMLDQPESPAALAWAKVLARAGELDLHIPHERDIDGGWGELLAARGDIDPSLIPDIDGDSLVLTDPITGEITRVEHVIGQGYEIIRKLGTDGNDIIDVVVNGPAITHINAMAGDDIINGSDERDIILGGEGNDTILGNGGDDWINSGSGDDTVTGNGGNDLIYGSNGNDILEGAENDDDIHGGAGNDTITGRGGFDRLYGGEGDDLLIADPNPSSTDQTTRIQAHGGEGDDTIIIRSYNTEITGGRGNDLIQLENQSAFVTISRGDGHDVIEFVPTGQKNHIRFDHSISANELWFQRIGDDLRVLVLNEPQSVTIRDYFTKTHNLEINAGDAYLEPDALSSQIHLHHQLATQPSGTNNSVSDAALQQVAVGSFWRINTSSVGAPPAGPWLFTQDNTIASGTYASGDMFQHIRFGGSALSNIENTDRIIFGGNSSDSIIVSGGTATVYGGAGNDNINANLNTGFSSHLNIARLYGDSGNDVISGSHGKDIIQGGTGSDVLQGWNGDDLIFGNSENDTIYGGDQNDTLHGDAGDDFLSGDNGNDTLFGGEGNDTLQDFYGDNILHGGSGNDVLTSGSGNDVLEGDDGNDLLQAGAGNDRISGGRGADTLYGGSGRDTLNGGENDDILNGNDGNDRLYGGSGNDLLIYDYVTSSASIDTYDGGSNTDELRLRLTTAQLNQPQMIGDLLRFRLHVAEQLAARSDGSTISYAFALMALTVTAVESISVELTDTQSFAAFSFDEVIGSNIDDTLVAPSSWHAYLDGAAGNDNLSSGAGDDVIYGGSGNDIINTGDGWNLVRGGEGDDVITGGSGADELHGDAGEDIIYGGASNDIVEGDIGNDDLSGEDGDDTLSGGAGNDTIDGGAGNDIINGDSGDDNIQGGTGDDTIIGGLGSDTITAGAGNDLIYGGAGADMMTGGEGADTFAYTLSDIGSGADTITDFAVSQNDRLRIDVPVSISAQLSSYITLTASGLHTLVHVDRDGSGSAYGNLLVATLENVNPASIQAERLEGAIVIRQTVVAPPPPPPPSPITARDDQFSANKYYDAVVLGNVLADNGNGADISGDGSTLFVRAGIVTSQHGIDVVIRADGSFIYPITTSFSGSDTFTYDLLGSAGASDTGTVAIQINVADFVGINGSAGSDYISTPYQNNRLNGRAGDDSLYGHHLNDVILGEDGQDNIHSYMGNDLVYGGNGNDGLYAYEGDDTIYGGSGIDSLTAAEGNDRLYGEDGDDWLFGISGNNLLDGGAGDDNIQGGTGDDTIIGGLGSDTITAGAGNDLIYGGAGADMMTGGEGADTFAYTLSDIGSGADTITDFAVSQNDRLRIDVPVSISAQLSSYITLTASGLHTLVHVDRDGSGSAYGNLLVATLENVNPASIQAERLEGAIVIRQTVVAPPPPPPPSPITARDDQFSANKYYDAVVLGNVLADNGNGADISGDGSTLFVRAGIVTSQHGIDVVIRADGSFIYPITTSFSGSDTFTYDLLGSAGASDTGTVAIQINVADFVGINGSAGSDYISTPYQNNRLNGRAGDDSLYGHHLNDVILGEDGQDNIHSYMGNDLVYGGNGNDGLYAYEGDDTIYGGSGIDSLTAAEGNDRLYGEDGDDWLFGISGNNLLDGGAGDDNIQGGTGDDTIIGGLGSDTITAGAGNDLIYGGAGADMIYGQAGADVFAFDLAVLDGTQDTIFDFSLIEGDKIDISNLITGFDPLTELISDFIQITDNGTDSVVAIDANGGADQFIAIATLKDITGLTDEQLLYDTGKLIAA